jgi:hypothetical protein
VALCDFSTASFPGGVVPPSPPLDGTTIERRRAKGPAIRLVSQGQESWPARASGSRGVSATCVGRTLGNSGRVAGSLGATLHPELRKQVGDVVFHRLFRQK